MSKAELVARVKELQRSGQQAKEAWWAYCDENLGGVRDPSRHEEDVLSEFLSKQQSLPPVPPRATYRQPARVQPLTPLQNPSTYHSYHNFPPQNLAVPAAGVSDVASWIKLGQRASPHWKNAWAQYCSLYGGGINDPARHDESHLVGFVDYLGQLAVSDLQASGVYLQQEAPRGPMKRHDANGSGAWATAAPMKRPRYDEPSEGDFIGRVKALQRRNPETKQAWQDFCDAHPTLQGVKDPAKHSSEDLQTFISQHE